VTLFFWKTPLPKISDDSDKGSIGGSILREKNLILGVVAQFFYVGAQVCVGSFFIRFSQQAAGLQEKAAADLLSVALLGFMIGRFLGTFLMRYISPAKLLAFYSLINFSLIIISVLIEGKFAVYTLVAVEFFMSIMFPTIFSLSIRGLGQKTKMGSSLLIMSIVGGAIFPVLMGRISDMSDMQTAYLVPCFCFLVVFYFAVKNFAVGKVKIAAAH
jgi:FHS family L-fucose permease-like MFS transporter